MHEGAELDEGKKNAIKAGNLSLKGTMITLFRWLHMISVFFFLYVYPAERSLALKINGRGRELN